MEQSHITALDHFLILSPFELSFFVILFVGVVGFFLYKYLFKNASKPKRTIFIAFLVFVLVNAAFIPFYYEKMYLEIVEYAGKDSAEKQEKLLGNELNGFITLLKEEIDEDKTIYFAEKHDKAYQNIKAKFQIAYHLQPRNLSKHLKDSDYLIIVNYAEKPSMDIDIPKNRIDEFKIYRRVPIFPMPHVDGKHRKHFSGGSRPFVLFL
jgi:hypothetical protein